MAILDSLFKAVEKLGGSINDDLSIQIKKDIVHIRVAESKDKVKHEITKQEAQALLKYEDEKKQHGWASKPQIRQYDQVYNGRIRIVFGEKKYIRDSEKEKLEERLGDILISLYEKAEDYRIASEIRAYINAMIENGNKKATSEWIEWASKKADWYDPTLDVEDEYLGRREHGKNKEEKDLDKANVYMRRYW
jgi:hypothetical protein